MLASKLKACAKREVVSFHATEQTHRSWVVVTDVGWVSWIGMESPDWLGILYANDNLHWYSYSVHMSWVQHRRWPSRWTLCWWTLKRNATSSSLMTRWTTVRKHGIWCWSAPRLLVFAACACMTSLWRWFQSDIQHSHCISFRVTVRGF